MEKERQDCPSLSVQIAMRVRWLLLRMRGVQIKRDTSIFGYIHVVGNPKNILIGKKCRLNHGVHLNAGEKIILGDNVTLSTFVQIHTGYYQAGLLPRKHIREPVVIKDNVWIASGAVVSAGVVVSENTIVGANSVVINDLEPNSFYAGVPAIKRRNI